MELSSELIIIVLLASFAAYLIKAVAGFGLSLVLVPVLSLFLDFKDVVLIATLSDLLSSSFLIFRNHKALDYRKIIYVVIGIGIGTFIGVKLFGLLSVDTLKKLFGMFLIVTVIRNYLNRDKNLQLQFSKIHAFLAGILGGILGGLFNTNGPPIVLYLKKIYSQQELIRTNLSAIFAIDALWRASLFVANGYINRNVIEVFSFGALPGLIIGFVVGEIILKRVESKHVAYLIEFLLFFIGGGLLLK